MYQVEGRIIKITKKCDTSNAYILQPSRRQECAPTFELHPDPVSTLYTSWDHASVTPRATVDGLCLDTIRHISSNSVIHWIAAFLRKKREREKKLA